MPPKRIRAFVTGQSDLTGLTLNRWFVVGPAAKDPNRTGRRWHCRCRCGVEAIKRDDQIRFGDSKSCGCLAVELSRQRKPRLTHGLSDRPEFDAWLNMIERCYNPSHKSFRNYGERGIRVCDRWKNSPEAFVADIGSRPTPKHSIDRIDNDGDYEPDNCRWATAGEQCRNQRRNVYLEHDGLRMTLMDWSRHLGIDHRTIYARYMRGWTIERILTPALFDAGGNYAKKKRKTEDGK